MKRQINQNISKKIEELFSKIDKENNSLDNAKIIKEIREISKRSNFPLREKRKLFCKKCLNYFFAGKNCEIKINKKLKSIKCLNCGFTSRYRIIKRI